MDINKELAELLGNIKTEYQVKINHNNYTEYQYPRNKQQLINIILTYRQAKVVKVDYVCPDFTQPENFVKLLTIDFSVGLVIGIPNVAENYVKALICLLPNLYECDKEGLDRLKTQAQQVSWQY